MDRTTVFTKTAKGLMEATGKTSVLSRDLRALLKEIDGKATMAEVQTRFGKMPEPKLQEALNTLAKDDFIREFAQATQTPAPPPPKGRAAPPPKGPAASEEMDLDFTTAIPTLPNIAKQAEEAARQKAQAEAAARARAEAEVRVKAAAQAAARAKAEAEAKARAEAEARARAEAEARAKAAAEAVARAKAEAEAKARAEAEARAKAEAEARAKAAAEAAARAKAEAEAKARAEARAKAEAEARAKRVAEEQARIEAEERARVETELKAKLEEERKAREEAERKAKEEAERERREAEEKARREADELRAKIEEERRAREEAERKAKEQAERERKEAEEKARREADELRAKLEEERRAREEAERKADEHAERNAKEHAERVAREAGERARQEKEDQARREADAKARKEAEEQARREAEEQANREAEEKARNEAADEARRDAEAREKRAAEERSRKEDEDRAKTEADVRAAAEEAARRAAAEQAPAATKPGPSLDDLVKIEFDFDADRSISAEVKPEAAKPSAGADDNMLKALEEKARKEAEEKARLEAEERAQREAEAEEERAAEERRKDEEAQQTKHGKGKARSEPVTPEREYAEAKARLDAQNDETESHFADMEKELEDDAAAAEAKGGIRPAEPRPDAGKRDKEIERERVRAEAAARAEAQMQDMDASAAAEKTPVAYRTPVKWGKPVALLLFLLLILGLGGIHFVSFDGQIPQFEKLAGAHLQQPVKIKALHLSLVPLPHWRLDGVSVGNEGQLAVAQIKAVAELGSMFSDKKTFKSIELESPVLSEEGFIALLFGKPQGRDLKVASVIVRNGKLDSKTITLPVLDAKIAMGEDGAWQKIALETPDHKTSLLLEPKGEDIQLEVETNAFSMPFGPAFMLENFSAKGVIGRNELRLSEFKGGIYGGYLSGSASLKWGADWSLGGEVSARAMDPGTIAPALLEDGKLEGKARYAMRAKSYDELFAAPRVEGTFDVQKGSLLGVDLARLLQGGGVGGKTAFAELTGSFAREGGRTQLRQVRLSSGPVSASGGADVDAGKNISGRFAVELKSPVAQARANLAVSGNLREPRFSR